MNAGHDGASAQYKRFEDRFRGSRELVKARLQVYAPILDRVERAHGAGEALDLGCGRGEWLDVLKVRGWRPIGVDTNEVMIADARAHGLDARPADALEHLRAQAPGTLALVSALHVVEHVPYGYLCSLIGAALTALRPGGLLLIETPNPENVSVSSWSFHLDPSHMAPLPPELLAFLVRDAGFETADIVTMNGEDAAPDQGPLEKIVWTLFSAGPDYAVIALKAREGCEAVAADIAALAAQISQPRSGNIVQVTALARAADQGAGSAAIYESLDAVRHATIHHGVQILEQLADLHERVHALKNVSSHHKKTIIERLEVLTQRGAATMQAMGQQASRIETAQVLMVGQVENLARGLGAVAQQVDAAQERADHAARMSDAIHHHVLHGLAQMTTEIAAMRSHQMHLEHLNASQSLALAEMRRSTSWRITAPLRGVGGLVRSVGGSAVDLLKAAGRAPLVVGLRLGRRHPTIARLAYKALGGAPWLGPRLVRFAQVRGYGLTRAPSATDEWRIDAPASAMAVWRSRIARTKAE